MVQLDIEVKKSGFPVTIGKFEFWLDTSVDNVKRLMDYDINVASKINEIEKEIMEKFGDKEITEYETLERGIELGKQCLEIQYDLLLGEGTFEKLYEEYPDLNALTNSLDLLQVGIVAKMDELNEEQMKMSEEKKQRLLKALKKKNKKK
jgi:hypothetical protein|nr:MAG TPA: tail assembly chaperone [Caudoviricetes sp.]